MLFFFISEFSNFNVQTYITQLAYGNKRAGGQNKGKT